MTGSRAGEMTVERRLNMSAAQHAKIVWSAKLIERLCELWDAGHSTAEIGRRLGVSKNSVVSAAHRYGCPPRPSPIKASQNKTKRATPVRRAQKSTLPGGGADPFYKATAWRGIGKGNFADEVTGVFLDPVKVGREAYVRETPTVPLDGVAFKPRVSKSTCCWPLGEPGTPEFRFCGDPSVPAKPYCEEHVATAYVKRTGPVTPAQAVFLAQKYGPKVPHVGTYGVDRDYDEAAREDAA